MGDKNLAQSESYKVRQTDAEEDGPVQEAVTVPLLKVAEEAVHEYN